MKGPFKLKSGNKPSLVKLSGASPMQKQPDTKPKKVEKKIETKKSPADPKGHEMWGAINTAQTKIVNKDGNYVAINSKEGKAILNNPNRTIKDVLKK